MSKRSRRSRTDLEEEIRSHLEHEADALVEEGMTRPEARAAAHARFGDIHRALPRRGERGGAGWLPGLSRDVGLAVRTLRRTPAFTVVAILTLTLGIGMNSAIFTFLYSMTMRGLPLPRADRLVTVHQLFDGMPPGHFPEASMVLGEGERRVRGTSDMVSWEEYLAYRDRSPSLAGLAGFAMLPATLAGESAERVAVAVATCDYFRVLRAPLALGRGLDGGDCVAPGESPVAVLAHGLWQSRFGGDPGIVGRTIRLNRTSFTVVGVAGRGFGGTTLEAPDLWVPVTMEPSLAPDRLEDADLSWLALVGRLRRGATREQAAAGLTAIGRSRDASRPGRRTTVLVRDAMLLGGPSEASRVLAFRVAAFALAGLILLIACLNVASLMLARAPGRQRDVRIRRALGAARHRVVGQLLVESVLLALVGGLAGLGLAVWLPRVFGSLLLPTGAPVPLTPDLGVVAYALGVSFLAAVAFGLAPALETSRVDLASALRGDAAGAGRGPGAPRLRQAVVAAQVAGSLVLLVVAGLFGRSIALARGADPGYRVDHVYGFRPDLDRQGYSGEEVAAFYEDWESRVAGMPGVEAVALTSFLPLQGQSSAVFMRDPDATETDFSDGQVFHVYVSAEYFATLGIPILRGSGLPGTPPAPDEPLPAVIGQTMARRLWPDRDPLGQVFAAPTGRARRVVGIARDALHGGPGTEDRRFFYSAIPRGMNVGTLVVRTGEDPGAVASVLRAAHQLDPEVLVTATSLRDLFRERLRPARLAALAAGGLGLLALLLAVVGIYGAVAHGVSQRSREFGVRFALGASRRDIRLLVLRRGVVPVGSGVASGLVLAAAVAGALRGRLYGLAPLDPVVFVGTACALAAAALAAMLRPARRAASLDPARTLREE